MGTDWANDIWHSCFQLIVWDFCKQKRDWFFCCCSLLVIFQHVFGPQSRSTGLRNEQICCKCTQFHCLIDSPCFQKNQSVNLHWVVSCQTLCESAWSQCHSLHLHFRRYVRHSLHAAKLAPQHQKQVRCVCVCVSGVCACMHVHAYVCVSCVHVWVGVGVCVCENMCACRWWVHMNSMCHHLVTSVNSKQFLH